MAIDTIKTTPKQSTKAVQAVILLTDGNWNNDGSPAGHGTGWPINESEQYVFSNSASVLESNEYRWYPGLGGTLTKLVYTHWRLPSPTGESLEQNLSIYANNSHIRFYAISFAGTMDQTANRTYTDMTKATGGFYQHAATTQQLVDIYSAIAGKLKEEAGVNVSMGLNYDNVEINSTIYSGGEVFDYVYNATKSTREDNYFPNGTHKAGYPLVRNQSSEWTAANDYTLHFNIGNISLFQTWEATYRLRVKKDGNINLFNNDSIITFNNGQNTLKLPKTFISAIPNMKNESIQNITLDEGNVTTNELATIPISGIGQERIPGLETSQKSISSLLTAGSSGSRSANAYCRRQSLTLRHKGHSEKIMRTVPGAEEAINNYVQIMFRLEAYASDAGEPEIVISQSPSSPGGGLPHIKLE